MRLNAWPERWLRMPEPRYKVAFFHGMPDGIKVADRTYSWDDVLALVRRNREDGLNLCDIHVLPVQEAEIVEVARLKRDTG